MINYNENILVFDGLLSNFQEDYYHSIIFGKSSLNKLQEVQPLVDFTVKYELTAQEGDQAPMSLMHILKSSPKLSPFLETFSQIPIRVCEHVNKFLYDIMIGRIWLTFPYKTDLDYARPHTDFGTPHWVVLYYVNDSDGDTVFFDNNNDEIKRVTPKKGRIVLFNGSIMHSGGIPKEHPRCVINFNIAI